MGIPFPCTSLVTTIHFASSTSQENIIITNCTQFTEARYTRCVIITVTLNFQGQNLVNMQFICTKISGPRHEIMLREVLPELSTICTDITM